MKSDTDICTVVIVVVVLCSMSFLSSVVYLNTYVKTLVVPSSVGLPHNSSDEVSLLQPIRVKVVLRTPSICEYSGMSLRIATIGSPSSLSQFDAAEPDECGYCCSHDWSPILGS